MTEQSGTPTDLSIQSTRQNLVSLYVAGSKTDAEALFRAVQGATDEAWMQFERILDPVNKFVIMGELPYTGATVVAYPDSGGLTPPADPESYHAEQQPAEDLPDSSMTAAELIARAQAATTDEELDLIEGAANGRVTVLDAVEARREALTTPA